MMTGRSGVADGGSSGAAEALHRDVQYPVGRRREQRGYLAVTTTQSGRSCTACGWGCHVWSRGGGCSWTGRLRLARKFCQIDKRRNFRIHCPVRGLCAPQACARKGAMTNCNYDGDTVTASELHGAKKASGDTVEPQGALSLFTHGFVDRLAMQGESSGRWSSATQVPAPWSMQGREQQALRGRAVHAP